MKFLDAQPSAPLTATEILERLPPTLSQEREDMLLQFYQEGHIPTWARRLVSMPLSAGTMSATIYVMADYLCLGTEQDWVYTPMSPLTAEKLAGEDGMLPTRHIARRIHQTFPYAKALPWGPPYDFSMTATSRWKTQTKKITKWLAEHGKSAELAKAGHFKDVLIGKGMTTKQGRTVGIWGWLNDVNDDGVGDEVIQGESINWSSHGVGYADYSHGCRLIRAECTWGENGAARLGSIPQLLTRTTECILFSDEGVLVDTSYTGTRARFGVTSIDY